MSDLRHIFLSAACLIAVSVPAHAEWVGAEAEQIFGPEMAEAEACRVAQGKAKEAALRRVLGERLAAEELLACSDRQGDGDCSLNRVTWSMIDGDIKGLRDVRSETRPGPVAGFRRCVVHLAADIGLARGQADPGFDLTVRLNKQVFRDGEAIELALSPSQPMHVAVFQWLPYEQNAAPVIRVFPNAFEADDRIIGAATIPGPEARNRYGMTVTFPDGLPADLRMVDEYLMVVATRAPVTFRETYSLEELQGRLLELPRSDNRLIKRAYSVVRSR